MKTNKLLALLLVLPLLVCCNGINYEPDEETSYEGAAPELKNGDEVLATNPNVQKFLSEVEYPDKDYSYTKVLDYYGGFNGKTYNDQGQEDPAGVAFSWTKEPDSDIPPSYSIRWSQAALKEGALILHLEDKLSWKADIPVPEGQCFINISNLVPNDRYTYKVSSAKGRKIKEGSFTTTGLLHQLHFQGDDGGVRNVRDLGGWKTIDGKTVKYRKLYRGGRMNDPWETMLNEQGKKEVLIEGIGSQLDLRGKSDVMDVPAVEGLAHCAPCIEEGGRAMLVKDAAKTKECFEFIVNSLKSDRPVFFHCSLGRDRTGTLDILLLGLLGVSEGDIGKAYEVTYFAPVGYSVSSSEKDHNPKPIFKNTRKEWVYSDVVPLFWTRAGKDGTFAEGAEKYLLNTAKVSQQDIDDFRNMMLE